MAVTRLKRKDRRNKSVAKNKVARIQHLNSKPVIKNVDVEEITASFAAAAKKEKPVAKKKVEAPKEEVVAETKAPAKKKAAPKAKKTEEVKEEKPKATKKKAAKDSE